MEPEVHYCTTSDGIRIAYSVTGRGPALLSIPGFLESFALDYLVPFSEEFYAKLGAGRSLIRYDMRGIGLSEPNVDDTSHERLMLDLEAVVDAANLDCFSIWASTTAGPRAIEYAARHPDRVERLILYGTFARGLEVMPEHAMRALSTLARANWQMGAQVIADMSGRRDYAEVTVPFADLYVKSTTGETAARMIESFLATDVTELLRDVSSPTLVLHRRDDPIMPFGLAQSMAARIPHAKLVPLAGNMHAPQVPDAYAIIEQVDAFLPSDRDAERTSDYADPQTPFRTILFTDLVGHTTMMQRLGDEKGRSVLREHERVTRAVLKEHGGREVKVMGDGFMASFGSVQKAVECAIELQKEFAAYNVSAHEPLNVRVGLNAGEPIEEDGDLFGATVILASRIAAKAGGGEVLVADTVRGLCSGKGFLFADRGEFVAKGFEEPVRISEVRWHAS